MNAWFTRLSDSVSEAMGHWATMLMAIALILVWLASGPTFRWSDTWQLIANTFTTLVTFLLGFLICAASNRAERRIRLINEEVRQLLREEIAELTLMDELLRHESEEQEQIEEAVRRVAAAVQVHRARRRPSG